MKVIEQPDKSFEIDLTPEEEQKLVEIFDMTCKGQELINWKCKWVILDAINKSVENENS